MKLSVSMKCAKSLIGLIVAVDLVEGLREHAKLSRADLCSLRALRNRIGARLLGACAGPARLGSGGVAREPEHREHDAENL